MKRESENVEWLKARLAMAASGLSTAVEDADELGVNDEVSGEIEEARESASAALQLLEDGE